MKFPYEILNLNEISNHFYDKALLQAANNNQIELVYYLLMKRNELEPNIFTSMTKIAIPPSIISISKHAFEECQNLTQVFKCSIPKFSHSNWRSSIL